MVINSNQYLAIINKKNISKKKTRYLEVKADVKQRCLQKNLECVYNITGKYTIVPGIDVIRWYQKGCYYVHQM